MTQLQHDAQDFLPSDLALVIESAAAGALETVRTGAHPTAANRCPGARCFFHTTADE